MEPAELAHNPSGLVVRRDKAEAAEARAPKFNDRELRKVIDRAQRLGSSVVNPSRGPNDVGTAKAPKGLPAFVSREDRPLGPFPRGSPSPLFCRPRSVRAARAYYPKPSRRLWTRVRRQSTRRPIRAACSQSKLLILALMHYITRTSAKASFLC